MTTVFHPAADEAAQDYLVYDASARHVSVTEPLRVFLEAATDAGQHPVLVTSTDARLSAHMLLALASAAGFWVVRADDGAFNGLTGRRLTAFPDLWEPTLAGDSTRSEQHGVVTAVGGQHGAFIGAAPPDRTVIAYEVYTAGRADESTVIGRPAQTMTTTLGGGPLDRWGLAEPVLDAWDPAAITAVARSQMPITGVLLATAPDAFSQTRVGRTKHGLTQHAVGGVCLDDLVTRPTDMVPLADQGLTTLAEAANTTFAMVWLTTRHGGAAVHPVARPPDQPLAAFLGPRAVHAMGADLDEITTRHDARKVGRSRTPALLVRFSDPDTGLWLQLARLAADLGPASITRALGQEPTHAS